MQAALLLLMLAWAGGCLLLWNLLFRPALPWRWALALVGLALVPHLPALGAGAVYGPFDTNLRNLPWAASEQALRQPSRGGALNDVTLQFVPWQEEARRQVLQGRVPLLNAFSAAGQSLIGNGQAAPFSLTSLLSLPVSAARAQLLRSFLKVFLALLGTFLAARELGCRPLFALLAAVSYAYGGSLAVWRLFPHGEVMALWPFAYLAVERILAEAAGVRACVLLGLAVAGMLLAGHPETVLMAAIALAGRCLLAVSTERRQRRAALLCVVLSLAALLATSFFTLPLGETILASEKLREQGQGRQTALGLAAESESWAAAVNHVAPGIFGTPQGSSEHGPVQLHWMAEGSVGLVILALALLGVLTGGRGERPRHYLALLFVVFFGIFLNAFSLAGRLFALPLVSVIDRRYSAYLAGFAASLLAGAGLERWCSREPGRGAKTAFALVAGTALVAAALARPIALRFWSDHAALAQLGNDVRSESTVHWLLALLAALALCSCFFLRARPVVLGISLLVAVILQLGTAYAGYTPWVASGAVYPPLAVVEAMERTAGPFRMVGTRGVFFPNSSTVYRVGDIRSHDPTESARYVDWLADFLDLDRSTYKMQYRRPKPEHLPFLRLLGVKYLMSGADLRLMPPWLDRGLFGATRLWELAGPVTWAFFPEQILPALDARAARRALRAQDPTKLATLERPDPLPSLDGSARPARADPQPNGKAQVTGIHVAGDRIEVAVSVDSDAWLILSQSNLPGWHAWADGRPAGLATADGALIAARIPAGTHQVRFRYLPGSFILGALLSALTCLAALAYLGHRTLHARARS